MIDLVLKPLRVENAKILARPFHLDSVKSYLRVYHKKDDDILENIINEAVTFYEEHSGNYMLNSSIISEYYITPDIIKAIQKKEIPKSLYHRFVKSEGVQNFTRLGLFFDNDNQSLQTLTQLKNQKEYHLNYDYYDIQNNTISLQTIPANPLTFRATSHVYHSCDVSMSHVMSLMKVIKAAYERDDNIADKIYHWLYSKHQKSNFI